MTTKAHVPGDVNHQFLAHAGHDFCSTCGVSLRGKRTILEEEMLEALNQAVIALHHPHNVPDMRGVVFQVEAAIRKAHGDQ